MWKIITIFGAATLAGGVVGYLLWPSGSVSPNPPAQLQANPQAPAAAEQASGESHLTDEPPLELQRHADEARHTTHGTQDTQLSADFECGLAPNVEKISDTHFALDMRNDYEHWFYFQLTGVAGKTIRVDFKNIPLEKWSSLNPVYADGTPTLADVPGPTESFNLADVPTSRAKNGALLPDTTHQSWHFISQVWASGGSTLSLVQTFDKDVVRLAMKTPFTVADENLLCAEASKCPDARVIDVGKTPQGRTLHVIKVSTGGAEGEKTHPCVVMYAREHADEPDSSWVVAGALRWLVAGSPAAADLRRRFTFLFIPVLDQDAAARSQHESIIHTFSIYQMSPEGIAYGKFFREWVRAGKPLGIVLDLHNVESAEAPHVVPADVPPLNTPQYDASQDMCAAISESLVARGVATTPHPWHFRIFDDVLGGWLANTYGPINLLYEFNSQEQHQHLTTDALGSIGAQMLRTSTAFLDSTPGHTFIQALQRSRDEYAHNWREFGDSIDTADPFIAEARLQDEIRNKALLQALNSSAGKGHSQ